MNRDHAIERIVAGCAPTAQKELLCLLSDAISVLDNLDVICPIKSPPCHDYLRFDKLRQLCAALRESTIAEDARPPPEVHAFQR